MNQDQIAARVAEARRDIARLMEEQVRHGAEVGGALDKIMVTLSGGALVFSMTFADRLAPARLWLPILFLSWFAFAVSIISVVFASRASQKDLSKRAGKLNTAAKEFEEYLAEGTVGTVITDLSVHSGVVFWNRIGIWSFVSAIVLLGVFVARNLLASQC